MSVQPDLVSAQEFFTRGVCGASQGNTFAAVHFANWPDIGRRLGIPSAEAAQHRIIDTVSAHLPSGTLMSSPAWSIVLAIVPEEEVVVRRRLEVVRVILKRPEPIGEFGDTPSIVVAVAAAVLGSNGCSEAGLVTFRLMQELLRGQPT